ncbi:MAG: FAD-dependent oxidoreductase [Actinomycetota bacterium]
MRHADVIVVGTGVMGAATARSLARAGRRVVALEQFEVGHPRGSSHGASRIFRFSYPDPRYVRMAMDSLPLWRELERETGESLLSVTGGLDTGKDLDEHASALEANGATFEWLDAASLAGRYPALALPHGARALFQPDAGFVAAAPAWRALARSASANGAELRQGVTVQGLGEEGGMATIRLDGESLRAPVAVVTAGGWARGLLAPVGVDLPTRVTRETVAYFHLPEEEEIPSVVDWGDPAVYALRSPGQGLKVGEHRAGPDTDPDERGEVSQGSVGRIREWVRERYPTADPAPHLAETCLYTNTADEEFIVERRGPFVIGSPCSGHGFKFAPLIGRRLAGLATTG